MSINSSERDHPVNTHHCSEIQLVLRLLSASALHSGWFPAWGQFTLIVWSSSKSALTYVKDLLVYNGKVFKKLYLFTNFSLVTSWQHCQIRLKWRKLLWLHCTCVGWRTNHIKCFSAALRSVSKLLVKHKLLIPSIECVFKTNDNPITWWGSILKKRLS